MRPAPTARDGESPAMWPGAWRDGTVRRSGGKGLPQPHGDQLLNQGRGKRLIDTEAQGPRRGHVSFEFFCHLGKDRTAVRQVAQMVLERGEPCDCLPPDLECRDAV